MTEWLMPALLVLSALCLILLLWLILRRPDTSGPRAMAEALQASSRSQLDHLERELRTEVQASARNSRQELASTLTLFQQK